MARFFGPTGRIHSSAASVDGGSGGNTTAEYLVGASDPDLDNERVVTNTATVTWDLTTPGQAKANAAEDHLSYIANISQAGTDPPDALIFKNTLSGPIVWSYDSPGIYFGTLASAFPLAGTLLIPAGFVYIDPPYGFNVVARLSRLGNSDLQIEVLDAATGAGVDGNLFDFYVQILVYP